MRAPIALRVNPDVEAGTHTTSRPAGARTNSASRSIGCAAVYEAAARMPHIAIRGVQMHIGSQITEAEPFAEAIRKVVAAGSRTEGTLRRSNSSASAAGWGLFIDRRSPAAREIGGTTGRGRISRSRLRDYAAAIVPALRGLGVRILLEPGRFLVGNAGVLLTRVRYLKQAGRKKFAIVDAGMNDLIRPALYQSYHEIVPVREPANAKREAVDVVGPVCESGDFFAQDRAMPELARRRSARDHERGRLRVRHGFELQFPAVAGGGARPWRQLQPDPGTSESV